MSGGVAVAYPTVCVQVEFELDDSIFTPLLLQLRVNESLAKGAINIR